MSADEGVKAARVAIRVLELLASHDEMGVTEIARATDTTKPRVYRHLRTLVSMGYALQREGSDRYARGPKLIGLARVIGLSAEDGVIELARPVLRRLHEEFDHTFNLSLVYGDSVSLVETVPGKGLVGIVMEINRPMPLHPTAAGKLLLAHEFAREGRLRPGKREPFTPHTLVDAEELRADLARISARGWAEAPEEVILGINALSAPVYDHRGELVAMVSAMDSIQFIPHEAPPLLVEKLCEAGREITARLAV